MRPFFPSCTLNVFVSAYCGVNNVIVISSEIPLFKSFLPKCLINQSTEVLHHRIIANWHANRGHPHAIQTGMPTKILGFLIYTVGRMTAILLAEKLLPSPDKKLCFAALMFSVSGTELTVSTAYLKDGCSGSICCLTITLYGNIS